MFREWLCLKCRGYFENNNRTKEAIKGIAVTYFRNLFQGNSIIRKHEEKLVVNVKVDNQKRYLWNNIKIWQQNTEFYCCWHQTPLLEVFVRQFYLSTIATTYFPKALHFPTCFSKWIFKWRTRCNVKCQVCGNWRTHKGDGKNSNLQGYYTVSSDKQLPDFGWGQELHHQDQS